MPKPTVTVTFDTYANGKPALDTLHLGARVRGSISGAAERNGRTYAFHVYDSFRHGPEARLWNNGRQVPESQLADVRAAVLEAYGKLRQELRAERDARLAYKPPAPKPAPIPTSDVNELGQPWRPGDCQRIPAPAAELETTDKPDCGLLEALKLAERTVQNTLTARGYQIGSSVDGWAPEVRAEVSALARIRAAIDKATGPKPAPTATLEAKAGDVVETDSGEKILLTEAPRWSDYHKRFYAGGFRFIKSKQRFSGNELLHNFTRFTVVAQ